MTGSFTPYGGNVETYEEWLIYSLDTSGNVDHQETIKTNSIQNFEEIFGEDLDGDNFTGLNIDNLETSSWTSNSQQLIDEGNFILKKDEENSLYILNSAEDADSLITISSNSCLLYTSPSPRDRQKSRMPSSA